MQTNPANGKVTKVIVAVHGIGDQYSFATGPRRISYLADKAGLFTFDLRMLLLGTAAVAGRVGFHLWNAQKAGDIGPLWPVFIAMVGVLYLWWLAALLFDLVFVWHLYIRHSKMLQRMDEIMGGWRNTDSTSKAGQSAVVPVAAPQVQS